MRAPPPQEGVATVFEEPAAGANGAAAAADHGRALLHDPRVARLGFALQFVIQACPAARGARPEPWAHQPARAGALSMQR